VPRRKTEDAEANHSCTGELRALFLMGLPGAGKSTVKRRRIRDGEVDISVNRFISRYPCQWRRDPEDGHTLVQSMTAYEKAQNWCMQRAFEALEEAVSRRHSLILDSCGLDEEWLAKRVATTQRAGYKTELLWVDVPLEIALFRNRDRGHWRWCPESIIRDAATLLPERFERLRKEVDAAEHLQNWSKRGEELRIAELDLHFYPVPRSRPPSLRPGCRGYGEAPVGASAPSRTPGSRRTLLIGPWKRTDEMARKKRERLTWMDRTYSGNREQYVSKHVLGARDTLLELNRYPYQLPPGVEHWTIWSRRSMRHKELCEYVEAWLDAREPHGVTAWNYDDNRGRRTIDIWHVHIYFQGRPDSSPLIGSRQASVTPSPQQRSPCSA